MLSIATSIAVLQLLPKGWRLGLNASVAVFQKVPLFALLVEGASSVPQLSVALEARISGCLERRCWRTSTRRRAAETSASLWSPF